MRTKIGKLSELSDILVEKDRLDSGILNFVRLFKVGNLLKSFSALKEQGYPLLVIITKLILIRLGGSSVYAGMKTGPVPMDDNTLYRALNDARVHWRKMLMSFALQFTRVVNRESEEPDKGTRCFVVDDSTLEKSGKTIEGVSRVNDHAKGGYAFGFKFLLLGYFDGTMLIPADFSLHRESQKTSFGLTKEEQRKQHGSRNPRDSHGETRKRELDEKKTDMAIAMIKRAVKRGL